MPSIPGLKQCSYALFGSVECLRLQGRKKGGLGNWIEPPSDTPLGPRVPSWLPRQLPPTAISGRFCRVEPIDRTRHGEALYAAYATDREGRLWTYLPGDPIPVLRNCARKSMLSGPAACPVEPGTGEELTAPRSRRACMR